MISKVLTRTNDLAIEVFFPYPLAFVWMFRSCAF